MRLWDISTRRQIHPHDDVSCASSRTRSEPTEPWMSAALHCTAQWMLWSLSEAVTVLFKTSNCLLLICKKGALGTICIEISSSRREAILMFIIRDASVSLLH